jgi:transcriptional regulator with XRE-family HTH domain
MTTIGQRLQSIRKRRGLTQQELAKESGVSLSLIRQLEQGAREDTRLETARKLAIGLRVPTSVLVVRPDADNAEQETVEEWEPVRRALVGQIEQPEDAPSVSGVSDTLKALLPTFKASRFSDIRPILPTLVRDAEALGKDGRDVRSRVLTLTGWLLTHTHQYDTASMAFQRAIDDAPDHLEAAAVVNSKCWLLIRQGKLADTRELATRWAEEVEPRMSKATTEELCTWGWLLLRVSTAAVRDNRPGEAEDTLRLARAASTRMGREIQPRGDFLRTFGPSMVALKSAENAIIEDRPDVVIQLSRRIPGSGIQPNSNNYNRHLLDVAEAHRRLREYTESFETLQQVRVNAPEWLREQRFARDIFSRITEKRRTLTSGMRDFADFIRAPY